MGVSFGTPSPAGTVSATQMIVVEYILRDYDFIDPDQTAKCSTNNATCDWG